MRDRGKRAINEQDINKYSGKYILTTKQDDTGQKKPKQLCVNRRFYPIMQLVGKKEKEKKKEEKKKENVENKLNLINLISTAQCTAQSCY